jgi:hypothetical protein
MKQKTALLALLAIVMIAGTLPSTTFAKEGRSGQGEGGRSEFRHVSDTILTSSSSRHTSHEENESKDDDSVDTSNDDQGQGSGRNHEEDSDTHHATSTSTTTTPTPRPVPTPVPCVASTSLQIAATIFTNTTVIKIKEGITRTVFESTATTSADIVTALSIRIPTATTSDLTAALTISSVDRLSTSTDLVIALDTCTPEVGSTTATTSIVHDGNLQARIAELQRLIQSLLKLIGSRFGL